MLNRVNWESALNMEPPAMFFDTLQQARDYVRPQIKFACGEGQIEQVAKFMFRKYRSK